MEVRRACGPVGDGRDIHVPAVQPVRCFRPPVANPQARSWSKPLTSISAIAIAPRQTTKGIPVPVRPGLGVAPRALTSGPNGSAKPEGFAMKARQAGFARPWSEPSPPPSKAAILPEGSSLGQVRQLVSARNVHLSVTAAMRARAPVNHRCYASTCTCQSTLLCDHVHPSVTAAHMSTCTCQSPLLVQARAPVSHCCSCEHVHPS